MNTHRITLENTNKVQKHRDVSKKYFGPHLISREIYPINTALALRDLLQDKIRLPNLTKIEIHKIKRRIRTIDSILSLKNSNTTYVQKQFLIRNTSYGYLRENKLGRLYSMNNSIPFFSKDIRFHLFKNLYADYDLVNCHPTILYEFALDKGLNVSNLKNLVEKRLEFNSKISQDLGLQKNVKKNILIAFYSGDDYKSNSQTLTNLHKEILSIRPEIKKYFITNKYFENLKNSSLNSIQAYYCNTVESETIINLRHHISNEIRNNHHDNCFEEEQLHFIPFYDGVFLLHEHSSINDLLHDYVKEFNNKSRFLKFEKKPIVEESDFFISSSELNAYKNIQFFLQNIGSSNFNNLLDYLDIPKFKLPEKLVLEIIKNQEYRVSEINRLKKEVSITRSLKKKYESKKIDTIVTTFTEKTDNEKELERILSPNYIEYKHQEEITFITNDFNSKVRKALLRETSGEMYELEEIISKISIKTPSIS